MLIDPDSERPCTLIDPIGPIAWLDNDTLVWRFPGQKYLVTVRFIEDVEVCTPLQSVASNVVLNGGSEEILSPDGKRVLVRRSVDGPAPTHLFVYDTA